MINREKLYRVLLGFGAFFMLSALTSSQALKIRPRHKMNYKEGEVLVKLTHQAQLAGSQKFALRQNAQGIKALNRSGLHKMKLRSGEKVEQALARLKSDPDVESVQPNFRYFASLVPNDTNYTTLWGMNNTGQTIASAPYSTNNPGAAGKDIGAEEGWDILTDCSSAIVAVIDTGVNYNHDDLINNMWDDGSGNAGYDFVDSDTNPMDLNGHGTHVAGAIGAEGDNSTGVAGVCWRATIMAVRALDASGSGLTSDVVSAVDYAVANNANVINMSLGGSSYDAALAASIQAASDAGIVIVAAAGNDGLNNNTNPQYPCNSAGAHVICVAALDQSYSIASFSNYGNTTVDMGAPGTNIRSTYHGTVTETSDDFSTGWSGSGTWAAGSATFGSTTYDIFTNPTNWNGTSTTYANSLTAAQQKTFNLSAADSAVLSFYAFVDTESSADYFRSGYNNAGGDPFSGGTTLTAVSGTTGGYAQEFSYDLSNCLVASCNIGFQLTSNASVVDYGVAVLLFQLTTTVLNATTYTNLNGTSMAAPYVAGVAAAIFAYNPNYTATDVVTALKTGGTSVPALIARTTTGKGVNLYGSLTHLNAPTAVTATVLPNTN